MSDPVTIKVVDRVRVEVGGGPPGSSGTWGTIVGTLANQTDLAAALDAKVEPDTPVNHLTFDTAPSAVPTAEGTASWDSDDKTLRLQTEVAATKIQVGQEQVVRAVNKTGATLTDGTVVAITGAQGNRAKVDKAIATSADDVRSTIGMVTSDILNNATGYVTTMGLVRGVNCGTASEGDTVYLSDTTSGAFTATPPGSPAALVRIGWVVTSGSNGTVLVHPETISVERADIRGEDVTAIALSIAL